MRLGERAGWCRRTAVGLACGVALALAGGCGGGGASQASEVPHLNTVVAPGVWVVLGSSSAAGVGATAGQGWVARVSATQSLHAVQVLNLAVGGSTTHTALPTTASPRAGRPAPDRARNLDRALAAGPRLLLLAFPSNDTAAGYDAAETIDNLLAVRNGAAAGGVPTVVLGMQPRDSFTATQADRLRQIDHALASQLGPCFVPLRDALSDGLGRIRPDFAAGDGVHLNDAGHALIADLVQSVLDSGLCVQVPGR